jgi:hypothetical protein
MSDTTRFDAPRPTTAPSGTTFESASQRPSQRVTVPDAPHHDRPIHNVERPRTHPISYLAAALAALALVLSLAALARHDDHGYRSVRIGANDCVIGHPNGVDVLYCRAANIP